MTANDNEDDGDDDGDKRDGNEIGFGNGNDANLV